MAEHKIVKPTSGTHASQKVVKISWILVSLALGDILLISIFSLATGFKSSWLGFSIVVLFGLFLLYLGIGIRLNQLIVQKIFLVLTILATIAIIPSALLTLLVGPVILVTSLFAPVASLTALIIIFAFFANLICLIFAGFSLIINRAKDSLNTLEINR